MAPVTPKPATIDVPMPLLCFGKSSATSVMPAPNSPARPMPAINLMSLYCSTVCTKPLAILASEYNNIEPNKETKLTIYISDFKTNIPIENAKLEIDIPGIDVSKINILPSTEPGVYEVMTEFPEIRKYSFLLYITSGEISDVIAINDVDIGKTEEITDDHKESDSILSIFSGNILLITILIIFSIIIALVFYRLGLNKKTTEKLNDDYKITSSEERKI